MKVYSLQRRRYLAHAGCREGFRADRAAGLIYGPYAETDVNGRVTRFLSGPEEASMLWKQCAYCGSK